MYELADNRKDWLDNVITEEKINGKIYLMARPSINHMRTQRNICDIFESFFRKTGRDCEAIFEAELDAGKGDYVVPDVMVLCYSQQDGGGKIPLIVIEVLSKSTRTKDLREKMELYANLGVKEYWIADYNNLSVDIYILDETARHYKAHSSYSYFLDEDFPKDKQRRAKEEEKVIKEFSPVLFPELIIKVEDIFYRVIPKQNTI